MSAIVDLVRESLATDSLDRFAPRVRSQARELIDKIERGELNNPDFAIGLELEVYAVDGEGRLAPLPASVFDACNKELGQHNAELNSPATPFDHDGIRQQADSIELAVSEARAAFADVGLDLALDAMWTIPPAEGTRAYLAAVESTEGVTIATNMQQNARYCALDNAVLERRNGSIDLDLPGCTASFPTILPESLTTSIQPHLQIPTVEAFPAYYNMAIRTMAPVLALATNSPFLPADLYDGVDDPDRLIDETFHELRIPVFEQAINSGDAKVRFPRDIGSPTDVVTRIADDAVRAPFLREWIEDGDPDGFRDGFWELDHKRGTYWRWLRGIPGGQPVGNGTERSLRIEYRPLPTQPTVRETIGLQWLTVGLIRGLVEADHPLASLDWETARTSFYNVVERGMDARIEWVTEQGTVTDDRTEIFDEIFSYARAGLAAAGATDETVDPYLDPIEARWPSKLTPSRWKLEAVRAAVAGGERLDAAIVGMQRRYFRMSVTGDPLVTW